MGHTSRSIVLLSVVRAMKIMAAQFKRFQRGKILVSGSDTILVIIFSKECCCFLLLSENLPEAKLMRSGLMALTEISR